MSDPLILAIDTSAAHCAAALLLGNRLVAQRHDAMAKGQAERLFPMLEDLLSGAGHHWRDLSALAVGIGPGNFTGVRIAVSAARGLALALEIPALGISTFEALAHDGPRQLLVALDARGGRLYLQRFGNDGAEGPQILENADGAKLLITPGDRVTGDGLAL